MCSYKYNKIRGKIQTPAAFCPAANQSADTAAGFSCAGQPNAAAGAASYGLSAADTPCLFVGNPYAGGRRGDFGKRILLLAGKFGGAIAALTGFGGAVYLARFLFVGMLISGRHGKEL